MTLSDGINSVAKILIVISSDIYVRNYLTTDALASLEETYECHFLADNRISIRKPLEDKPGFLGYYSINKVLESRHRLLFNLLMWRHRQKSQTFLYRWLRNSRWHLIDRSHGVFRAVASTLRWLSSSVSNPEGLIVPLLGNRLVFPLSSRVLKYLVPVDRTLWSMISEAGYEIVIFPSAAFDAVSVDLARACDNLRIPSLCLIDNWDNLTSKTVFWAKPSHLAVWGPQTKEQAIRIHNFEAPRVHEIGTPRFDQYFSARTRVSKSPYTFPYILFVGSAMPFDEISTLHLIEKSLLASGSLSPELRVVYRPHPWQQKRNVDSEFHERDFTKVILDTQIHNAHKEDESLLQNTTRFQPELSYYPNLLVSASCVVGPLTTMLLEASLCLRPVIGINYSDGIHSNTSLRYFSHFEGAERIPGFSFCDDAEKLPQLIERAITSSSFSEDESDAEISHFLNLSSTPYPERLANTVRNIIGKSEAK